MAFSSFKTLFGFRRGDSPRAPSPFVGFLFGPGWCKVAYVGIHRITERSAKGSKRLCAKVDQKPGDVGVTNRFPSAVLRSSSYEPLDPQSRPDLGSRLPTLAARQGGTIELCPRPALVLGS